MADRGRWSMARSRTQKKTSAIDVQRFSGRILEDKAGEGNMEIMQESTDHVDSFSL